MADFTWTQADATHVTLHTTLVAPPYVGFGTSTDPVPELGTLAVGYARSVQAVSSGLRPVLQRAPWCVPCLVVTPATADPAIVAAIHQLPGHPAFLREPALADDLPLLAASAVRHRNTPTGLEMASYVARRTGRIGLVGVLSGLLSAAAEENGTPRIAPRTLRDRMRRFGILTPRCWRTIGNLGRIAAAVSDTSVEVMAWRAGVGPRTLRSWSSRYLGTSLQEFRLRVGWEWVVEAALRTAGYLVIQPTATASIAAASVRDAVPLSIRTSPSWRLAMLGSRSGRPYRAARSVDPAGSTDTSS